MNMKTISSLVLSKETEKKFRRITEYVPFDNGKAVKRRVKGFDIYFDANYPTIPEDKK